MKLQDYQLPPDLQDKLVRTQTQINKSRHQTALYFSIFTVLASLLALYLSDRLWDTPVFLRFCLLATAVLGLAITLYKAIKVYSKFMCKPDQLLIMIQNSHPSLGDGLQGALELANETSRPANISFELCQAAIDQVATTSRSLDFTEAVPVVDKKKNLIKAAIVFLLVIFLATLDLTALKNSFSRWINPFAATERYTFVQMEKLPEEMIVLKGEDFTLNIQQKNGSKIQAESIKYHLGDVEKFQAAFNSENSTSLKIKGVSQSSTLYLSAGDWSHKLNLKVVQRPTIRGIESQVTLPAYTRQDKKVDKLNGSKLYLLEGSELKLDFDLNNKIKEAHYSGKKDKVDLSIHENSLSTPSLAINKDHKFSFHWEDIYGHKALKPYNLQIIATKDKKPEVNIWGLPSQIAVLEDDVLIMKVRASDPDFGLKDVAIEWTTQNNSKLSRGVIQKYSKILKDDSKSPKVFDASWKFSAKDLQIPVGFKVIVKASVTDHKPGRDKLYSRGIKIFVISIKEHEKIVRQRLDMVQSQLNAMASREREQLRRIQKLKEAALEALKNNDLEKLKELNEQIKQAQAQLKRQKALLKKNIEQTEKLLKEAFKNKNFSKEELASWMKNLAKMDQLKQNSIPEMEKNLAKLSQMMKNAQNMSEQEKEELKNLLEKALKQEQKMSEDFQDLAKQSEEDKKNDRLKNMAEKLLILHKSEKSINENFAELLPQLIGQNYENLDDKLKEQVKKLSIEQKKIQKDSLQARSEIRMTYKLSRIAEYNKVFQDMEKEKLKESTEEIITSISTLRVGQVIKGSDKLSKNFKKWSDILLPKPNKGNGGGQGGGNQPESDPRVIAEVIRIIMKEQKLYDETLYAQDNRKDIDVAKEGKKLKWKQESLYLSLNNVSLQVRNAGAQKVLRHATALMESAIKSLDGYKFDQASLEESAIIETLIQLFKPPAPGQGGGKPSKQKQAALNMLKKMLKGQHQQKVAAMHMQGQMAAQSGRGGQEGNKGGTSSNPGNQGKAGELVGDPNGASLLEEKEQEERRMNAINSEIPLEFKEALEEYYKQLEESNEN